MKLVIASNNKGKIREYNRFLSRLAMKFFHSLRQV